MFFIEIELEREVFVEIELKYRSGAKSKRLSRVPGPRAAQDDPTSAQERRRWTQVRRRWSNISRMEKSVSVRPRMSIWPRFLRHQTPTAKKWILKPPSSPKNTARPRGENPPFFQEGETAGRWRFPSHGRAELKRQFEFFKYFSNINKALPVTD